MRSCDVMVGLSVVMEYREITIFAWCHGVCTHACNIVMHTRTHTCMPALVSDFRAANDEDEEGRLHLRGALVRCAYTPPVLASLLSLRAAASSGTCEWRDGLDCKPPNVYTIYNLYALAVCCDLGWLGMFCTSVLLLFSSWLKQIAVKSTRRFLKIPQNIRLMPY